MKTLRLTIGLALLPVISCSNDVTQLLVRLHAEREPTGPATLRLQSVDVAGARADHETDITAGSLPVSFGIAPQNEVFEGPIRLSVTLDEDAGPLQQQVVLLEAVGPTRVGYVDVCLFEACADVRCETGEWCRGGTCTATPLRPAADFDPNYSCRSPESDAGFLDTGIQDRLRPDLSDGSATDGADVRDVGVRDSPDLSIEDADQVDASRPNWSFDGYNYRIRLELSATAATGTISADTVVRVIFNHASYVDSPYLAASDGSDLIVAYGGRQIARMPDRDKGFDRADTEIYFRLQSELRPGDTDDTYAIYFSNPTSALPPMTTTIPDGRIQRVETQLSLLAANAPTTMAQIELGQSGPDERWLLVAMWRARRTGPGGRRNLGLASFDQVTASVPSQLDGTALAGASSALARDASKFVTTWALIEGRPDGPITVRANIEDPQTPDTSLTVDYVRLAAVLLPSNESFLDASPTAQLNQNTAVRARVSLPPQDVVYLARGMYAERPDNSGHAAMSVFFVPRITKPQQRVYQCQDGLQNSGIAWTAMMSAGRASGVDVEEITIANASQKKLNSSSKGVGLFAVPANVFEHVQQTSTGATEVATSLATNETTTHAVLSMPAPPEGARDYFYLMTSTVKVQGPDVSASGRFDLLVDGQVDLSDEVRLQGTDSPWLPAGWVFTETATRGRDLRLDATRDPTADRSVRSRYTRLMGWRLKDPVVRQEPVEQQ